MDIVGKKYIFLSISGLLVLGSIIAILSWGLNLGIDFTGGSLLEIEFLASRPANEEIRETLVGLPIGAVAVQPTGEKRAILRFRHVEEPTHRLVLESLGRLGKIEERRFEALGPTIGKELKNRAVLATVVATLAIILYVAWAFRHVSKPVSSWKYGVVAVVALMHDVIIPTGVFAALGKFQGVEIDSFFVAALLTILGFSVHDTIVVFDRIRENLQKLKAPEPYATTVNRSVNESIVRSVNTSLTTLFVIAAIFFFGGASVKYLALALALGVIFGTYSSIFVASPLLIMWNNLGK